MGIFTKAYFEDAGRRALFTATASVAGALSQLTADHKLNDQTALKAAALAAIAAALSVATHAVLDPILGGKVKALFGGGYAGLLLLTAAQVYGAQVLLQLDSSSPFDAKAWSALAVSVASGVLTLVQGAFRQAGTDGPAPGLPVTDLAAFQPVLVADGTPGIAHQYAAAGGAPHPEPEA